MQVAHAQQGAGHIDRQVQGAAGHDLVAVHIAAVATGGVGHHGVTSRGGTNNADHGVNGEAQLVVKLQHLAAGVKLTHLAVFHQIVKCAAAGAGAHQAGGIQLDVQDLHLQHIAGLSAFHKQGTGGGILQRLLRLMDITVAPQTIIIAIAGLKNHSVTALASSHRGIVGAAVVSDICLGNLQHKYILQIINQTLL